MANSAGVGLEVNLIGARDLQGRFAKAIDEVADYCIEAAEALAQEVEREYQAAAPRAPGGNANPVGPDGVTGRFYRSWSGEATPNGKGFTVTVKTTQPLLARFLEGGTKPHPIEATNANALAFAWHGNQAFFAHVQHPGTKPNDWEQRLQDGIYDEVRAAGNKIASRVAFTLSED